MKTHMDTHQPLGDFGINEVHFILDQGLFRVPIIENESAKDPLVHIRLTFLYHHRSLLCPHTDFALLWNHFLGSHYLLSYIILVRTKRN